MKKVLFSAKQVSILKLTNNLELYSWQDARDVVVLITFERVLNDEHEPFVFTMPASVGFCRRYCQQFSKGDTVTPIISSEMQLMLR